MFYDELGRLAQGIRDIPGTDTIRFICRSAVPKGRTVTCRHIVVNYCLQKKDPNRTRLTVGDGRIQYPWGFITPTSGISTSKILFNSVISAPGEIFITIDIKTYTLALP